MKDKPVVKPKDWIVVGQRDAVVSHIYSEDYGKAQIEVIYIDDSDKAINEDVFWNGERWKFVSNDVSGGYADNYIKLNELVGILRRGKF